MTATRSLSASLQNLTRTLLDDPAPDAELVARFAARRDSTAFAALVRRYGGVVLGVCRRVLRHEQDAEDAFQATFLVFAKSAGSLRQGGTVGNWLYGVAHNVARKARTQRARRAAKEHAAAKPESFEPREHDDLESVLDAELAALPDKYRAAVVLCDLRGLTAQQAADELACPPKTVATRLLRGRERLARRLARRGVAPAAVAVVLVPSELIAATVRAVEPSAAVPPAVAALVTGASILMTKSILKCVLAVGVLGVTAVPLWQHLHAAPRPGAPKTAAAAPPNAHDTLRAWHDYLYGYVRGAFSILDDKKDKDKAELSGTWVKNEAEMKVTFEKAELKLSPHGKDDVILILCEYTADKAGLVKAKVTGFEGQENAKKQIGAKLPVGSEFTFKWVVTNGTAKLDDVKGKEADLLKSHLEGEFAEKK